MAEKLADAVVYLATDDKALKQGFADAETQTQGLSGRLGKIAAGALVGVGVAAAGAVVAVGKEAIQAAQEVETSADRMRSQLNLTAEEAEAFRQTMRDVYTDNFGDSYEDVAQSLTDVALQFERIGGIANQTQLKNVTETAYALQDAFGVGMEESVSAVVTLMEQFGLTSDEALQFVAGGFQRGLDSSGDFLDSIGEYSGQFSNMGANAGEFFSVLETGLQGGVLGTDKVADAFKEFNIRIQDGSDTTGDALAAIGVNYEELAAGFADGSITQIDAVQTVIEKIGEMEDPIERNKIGVALFGTQWEDLTDTVVLGIDTQKTGLGELEGSVESLSEQYDNLSSDWQSASRQMRDALVPVGDALGAILVELMPPLVNFINNQLVPALEHVAEVIERVRNLGIGGAIDQEIARQRDISLGERWQNAVGQWNQQWGIGNGAAATENNTTINVYGSQGYDEGREAGRGVSDELRARGYN